MQPKLFTPLTLRQLEIPNRIFVSPMCQYSSEAGLPTDWHLVHLGSRAVGGAGLVMVEASAVSPEARISPADSGIWSDEHAVAFTRITRFIKEQGSVAAIQLAHAGRKASTLPPFEGSGAVGLNEGGWVPDGPSAIAFSTENTTPHALAADEIAVVVEQFVAAARHARKAGFDVVELHMAHGYLLHSFLSPISNQRSDEWGGSLENRARLPLAVAEAVRAEWPADLPVMVRISATDWVEGGWDLEQSVQLAGWLKERGIDLIDCSSGGLTPDARIPAGPGFQTPFATAIRERAGMPTGAVGLITAPAQAEHILTSGQADAVLLARELLRDPYWPLHAAHALGAEVTWPKQYERARPR
ncbi:MAG: NADH:flavin oxidoreductase/NADH oxidase [Gammaproteobacteria bacterium]|jgi:2,4-dienoyl-CoA reductase-like NADH-dependent reductase (Old Yellow Enzyme family)